MSKKRNLFDSLLGKVKSTEDGYLQAIERKQEQLVQLQGELFEKEKVLRDVHRSSLLGEVSEKTYQDHKVEVDTLKKQISDLHLEMQYIDAYKQSDVDDILEALHTAKGEYSAEQQAEIEKLRYELHQKKLEFFEAMVSAKERYDAIVQPVRTLESLKIKFGKQQNAYTSDAFQSLIQIGYGSGGTDTLLLERADVYNALTLGKLPYQSVKIVEDGKQKGFLK